MVTESRKDYNQLAWKVMESINEKIGDYLYYEKVKEKER